jgi:hypothetical protein
MLEPFSYSFQGLEAVPRQTYRVGRKDDNHFALANAGKLLVSKVGISCPGGLLVDADKNEVSAWIFNCFALADTAKFSVSVCSDSKVDLALNVASEADPAGAVLVVRLIGLALTQDVVTLLLLLSSGLNQSISSSILSTITS